MRSPIHLIATLLLFAGGGVYACMSADKTPESGQAGAEAALAKEAAPADANDANDAAPAKALEAPQGPLAEVLAPYLKIGDQLSRDSVEGIDVEIAKLDQALAKFENRPELVGARAQLEALKNPELEAARAAFLPLSRAIIVAASRDTASQAGMIKVLCPMAFASKGGRWIQREGKIRNPFEGSRMLACGAPEPWATPAPPAATP
jgi:hypothetical protein